MPEASKKWDVAAERDLCMAMIVGGQDSERIKYNWPAVHAFMTTLGYNFTKDAISLVPFSFSYAFAPKQEQN